MSEEDASRMRASHGDRERVTAALSEAFSNGQLDYEEFDERAKKVWELRYRDELLTVLTDLVPDPAAALDAPPPAVRPAAEPGLRGTSAGTEGWLARRQVTGEPGGQAISFAMMGVSEKRGDWLLGRGHTSLGLMGSTVLDLRRARLSAQETTIWAFGLMGSVEILVPEDIRVLGDGIGILGSFEVRREGDVTVSQHELPDDAPVVRVRGLGLMGAISVRRVPRDAPD